MAWIKPSKKDMAVTFSYSISTLWEEFSDKPALQNRHHAQATRNSRRARAHTASLIETRKVKFSILWIIDSINSELS